MQARAIQPVTVGRAVTSLLLLVAFAGVSISLHTLQAGASTQGDQIAAKAASQVNVPYCDDGGDWFGPSHGSGDSNGCTGTIKGFDCMSLVQYAVYQVTGIKLPDEGQLSGVGTYLSASDTSGLQPGDATFWGSAGSDINHFSHSGIVGADGRIWDAVEAGVPVQEHTIAQLETTYNYTYLGAIRFAASDNTPPPLAQPVVGMAATPTGGGYWLTNAAGAVSADGDAVNYGSMAGTPLNAPIAHIVSSSDGKGYWLVAADGGIFSFGDAQFYGSMGSTPLNAPVVGIAPTPSGLGYWLVASDGGIFSFGDAKFHGSMGGHPLNKPVVGIVANSSGYWEVASDGGIFSFGATFYGSTGSVALNRPVNGMTVTPSGNGYLFVASDGGIFTYGDAKFHGSLGGSPLNAPIVGMATDRANGGYWLVASDGGVFSEGATFYGAD